VSHLNDEPLGFVREKSALFSFHIEVDKNTLPRQNRPGLAIITLF